MLSAGTFASSPAERHRFAKPVSPSGRFPNNKPVSLSGLPELKPYNPDNSILSQGDNVSDGF